MQNNTITFSTSDDPPQLLTISRSSLVAGSTVFRDMLSLPSQDSSSPIPLTETAKELKPLLLALEGDEDAFKKVMQNAWSSRRDWQTFAVLADKYDIASARRRIETQIWMLEAKPQDAGLAFMLAIHLQDKELMETTAKRAVRMSDHEIADLALGQEWKQRLRRWKALVAVSVLETLQVWTNGSNIEHSYRGGCSTSKANDPQAAWGRAIAQGLASFSLQNATPVPLVAEVGRMSFCCDGIRATVLDRATWVEEAIWKKLVLPLDY